ncbi:fucose 4-O-acetylase-like acetyltransferase [Novosphingobium chloroacetimidivorans]|uniref:Fucose 4-O-acetylase-like acetyltransferase n=1 Tax=Novosphingobium chloroacetimidivorans TaxID=1428314 RepID=A0A7W7K8J7_9SPHN|nr:acyltransferase family protein [Novosphingobium chloroacetimidivorans]MBB4858220.1 fucose 4-O-acetylase-like acetyltransferase [Novosphingobium chloroacetimidivorans]
MGSLQNRTALAGNSPFRSYPDFAAYWCRSNRDVVHKGRAMAAKRIAWIDNARGLGIVLVVLGHVITTIGSLPVKSMIFTFHMPLFVFLTTMVLKDEDWRTAAVSKARALLLPYVTYLFLLGLPACLYRLSGSFSAGIVYGAKLALGGTYLTGTMTAFWYMPAIYLTLLGYLFLRQRLGGERSGRFVAAMTVVALLAYAISSLRITVPVPLALHAVPGLVLFMWIGRSIAWNRNVAAMTVAAIAVVCVAIWIERASAGRTFQLDLKNGILGVPLLGILLACAGSQLVFALARLSERSALLSRLLGFLGRTTIPILFLHQAVNIGLRDAGINNQYILTVTALLLPALFALCVRRHLPAACPYLGIPQAKTVGSAGEQHNERSASRQHAGGVTKAALH